MVIQALILVLLFISVRKTSKRVESLATDVQTKALPTIETAQAILVEVRRRYAGAYLMPSFGRFEVVAEVLEAAR